MDGRHVHWLRGKAQELDEPGLVWGVTRTETKAAGAMRINFDSDGDVDGIGSAPSTKRVETAAPSIWYQFYKKEREHLVVVCSAALKAGVAVTKDMRPCAGECHRHTLHRFHPSRFGNRWVCTECGAHRDIGAPSTEVGPQRR